MTRRSRLSRRVEQQTKKTFFTSIIGIIVVVFLIFKLGIPLLINITLFLSGSKNSQDQTTQKNNNSFVPAPQLNSTFTATNSAQVSISGSAVKNEKINLYVNGEQVSDSDTKDDGSFSFDNVKLVLGTNDIKAKAQTQDNKESSFSDDISITYNNNPPKLSVDSPSDNQSFGKDSSPITVSGTTDPGVKVTVSGFWAIVDDSGKYSYSLPLQGGDNQIKVVATDDAGNTTEVDKKVTYSP